MRQAQACRFVRKRYFSLRQFNGPRISLLLVPLERARRSRVV